MQVTIHEAKTHLSRLIERVANGEEVIIAKRDKPIARLCPLVSPAGGSRIGGLKGHPFRMGDAFDDPGLNETLADDFSASV